MDTTTKSSFLKQEWGMRLLHTSPILLVPPCIHVLRQASDLGTLTSALARGVLANMKQADTLKELAHVGFPFLLLFQTYNYLHVNKPRLAY